MSEELFTTFWVGPKRLEVTVVPDSCTAGITTRA